MVSTSFAARRCTIWCRTNIDRSSSRCASSTPTTTALAAGGRLVCPITVTGGGVYTYRWYLNGNLISGVGRLPFNTDGGGLCNNHPANRGGVTKVIEAVRQLRGEAHPAVQVPNCHLALASGIGGALASRHTAATLILESI